MTMERIVMHWTGGGHNANGTDKRYYHFIVEGDGTVVRGNFPVSANVGPLEKGKYAAHTRDLNTGSIGVSLAAMRRAKESPFDAGTSPITQVQLDAFAALVAELAEQYAIPITRETVLTHAEVQPTLGVWQRQKWDITWLPGMARPGDPIEVGDRLRQMVRRAQRPQERPEPPVRTPTPGKRGMGAGAAVAASGGLLAWVAAKFCLWPWLANLLNITCGG